MSLTDTDRLYGERDREDDDRPDPDRIRKMPALPAERILSEALAGRPVDGGQQQRRPNLPLEKVLSRAAAGPAPERDERKQKILRLMTLGGALGTVLSGGAGNLGAIGAGLAQGGAEGLRQQDEDYALQTEGWQEQMQQIAEANAGVRERNAERQFERFMAEEKAGREREAAGREAEQERKAIRTRADAEARADVLKEKLLRGLPLSEKEQAEIGEIRSRRRENEAQAGAATALRDRRRLEADQSESGRSSGVKSDREKRLREINEEIYRVQQTINEVDGFDPGNAKRMRTHGQRLMDLVDERVRLQRSVPDQGGQEAQGRGYGTPPAPGKSAEEEISSLAGGSAEEGAAPRMPSSPATLQRKAGFVSEAPTQAGRLNRVEAMMKAGSLTEEDAQAILDAMGLD